MHKTLNWHHKENGIEYREPDSNEVVAFARYRTEALSNPIRTMKSIRDALAITLIGLFYSLLGLGMIILTASALTI